MHFLDTNPLTHCIVGLWVYRTLYSMLSDTAIENRMPECMTICHTDCLPTVTRHSYKISVNCFICLNCWWNHSLFFRFHHILSYHTCMAMHHILFPKGACVLNLSLAWASMAGSHRLLMQKSPCRQQPAQLLSEKWIPMNEWHLGQAQGLQAVQSLQWSL